MTEVPSVAEAFRLEIIGAMREGRQHQVSSLLGEALAGHPRDGQLLELAAAHAYKSGRSAEAASYAREALKEMDGVQMAERLAHFFEVLKLPADRIKALQGAVDLDPASVERWQLLAEAHAQHGQWYSAFLALQQALQRAPGDVDVLGRITDIAFDHVHPAEAEEYMRQFAIALPSDVDAQLKLGVTLGRLAEHGEAAAHYLDASKRVVDSADLWMALGQSLEYIGERHESREAYQRALVLRPRWAMPISALLGLSRTEGGDIWLQQAESLIKSDALPDDQRAVLGYEIGKVLDGVGRYSDAMAAWQLANAARIRVAGEFDGGKLKRLEEETVAAFSTAGREVPVRKLDASRPVPVFIVGMPRSGTTLTERILNAHPDAHGAGELLDLTLLANQTTGHVGRDWPAGANDLRPEQLERMAASYFASAMRHAKGSAAVVVDKAPLNFFFLGLAARLFPDAKVIWCRRDPRDVALSVYGENFSLDAPFSCSFDGIAGYMRAELTLMKLWKERGGLPIHVAGYEALVSDPEAGARALLDFVGLPWNPDCLEFHRHKQVVQTPSRWQVRQPIHRRSVARWTRYAEMLPPEIHELSNGWSELTV